MDAFVAIVKNLLEAVPDDQWRVLDRFPFGHLPICQAQVFDICLFQSQGNQGASGFAWLSFMGEPSLFCLPFRLGRHMQNPGIMTAGPWTLYEGSADDLFFNDLKKAFQSSNCMNTHRGGQLWQRILSDEPSFTATKIWGKSRNTCVCVDEHIVYKFFRQIDREVEKPTEVEVLEYLASQNTFSAFPRPLRVFTYTTPDEKLLHTALVTQYVPNDGELFSRVLDLMRAVRHPEAFAEHQVWAQNQALWRTFEGLGVVLADFHRAMGLAKSDLFFPQPLVGEYKTQWIESLGLRIRTALSQLGGKDLQNQYELVFEPDLRALHETPSLGLGIHVHGNVHLGQFLFSNQGLYLLDYEVHREYPTPVLGRRSCFEDVATLIVSLLYAWEISGPEKNPLCLFGDLVRTFLKFYLSTLDDPSTITSLAPEGLQARAQVLSLCFALRVLQENVRIRAVGSKHKAVWESILCDLSSRGKEHGKMFLSFFEGWCL
jgi:hypothetical protein